MMKAIQIFLTIVLLLAVLLVLVFVFNPLNLRNKIIGGVINSYLDSVPRSGDMNDKKDETSDEALKNESEPKQNDKSPLLNESQEKTLENFGVDVEKLPKIITPGMQTCFMEKLGEKRGEELIKGAAPSALEVVKVRSCLAL